MESLAYNVYKLPHSHLLWYQKPANPTAMTQPTGLTSQSLYAPPQNHIIPSKNNLHFRCVWTINFSQRWNKFSVHHDITTKKLKSNTFCPAIIETKDITLWDPRTHFFLSNSGISVCAAFSTITCSNPTPLSHCINPKRLYYTKQKKIKSIKLLAGTWIHNCCAGWHSKPYPNFYKPSRWCLSEKNLQGFCQGTSAASWLRPPPFPLLHYHIPFLRNPQLQQYESLATLISPSKSISYATSGLLINESRQKIKHKDTKKTRPGNLITTLKTKWKSADIKKKSVATCSMHALEGAHPHSFLQQRWYNLGRKKISQKKPPQLQKNPAQIQLTTSKGIFF
jgi:hypothetical protein